jgi:hypothetical protein
VEKWVKNFEEEYQRRTGITTKVGGITSEEIQYYFDKGFLPHEAVTYEIDDEVPPNLEKVENSPFYKCEGKYICLMMEGEATNHSGDSYCYYKEFDTLQEAWAYLNGVQDALTAIDFKLACIKKEQWKN